MISSPAEDSGHFSPQFENFEEIWGIYAQCTADLLKQNAGNVAEHAHKVGFSEHARFDRSFKKQVGCAPSEFRRKET
ncbi:MAG: helix-turn-helix domain-containing protein [bacterium]